MASDPDETLKRHVFTHPSSVEHWRHVVEIIALTVAAVWGFYVFVYQEKIKPATEAVNVDFTLNVNHENLIHDKELVNVVPTWLNRGTIASQIDGYIINVYGVRFTGDPQALRKGLPVASNGFVDAWSYNRGFSAQTTLIESAYHRWEPLGGHFTQIVEPNDTAIQNISVTVPRGVYEAIAIAYTFCERRGDDRDSHAFDAPRTAEGSFDVRAFMDFEQKHFARIECHLGVNRIFAI